MPTRPSLGSVTGCSKLQCGPTIELSKLTSAYQVLNSMPGAEKKIMLGLIQGTPVRESSREWSKEASE